MYGEFAIVFPFCFACGSSPTRRRLIDGYPQWLEIAHIIGGAGRTADRRNLVRLCKLCHDLSHGAKVKLENKEATLVGLPLGCLLWLKERHDPTFFDAEYLAGLLSNRRGGVVQLPELVEPDSFYMRSWEINQRNEAKKT